MKISKTCALFQLFFQPKKLIEEAKAYNNTYQPEISINEIRKSLLWSFLLVFGAIVTAGIVGRLYFVFGGVRCQTAEEILQYVGIGILLWATLGKAGWSIETMDRGTIPELVNEWAFRALYVLGSFLLALAVSLTFGSNNT